MKGVKIGNIKGPRIGAPRAPGLGARIKRLGNTALDRGEAQAKSTIEDLIPEPGSMEDDLDPEEQEQALEGLAMFIGAMQHARSRQASRAVDMAKGLYQAVGGFTDDSMAGADDDDEYGSEYGSEGIVDIIGLDAAGGLVRPGSSDDGEWR